MKTLTRRSRRESGPSRSQDIINGPVAHGVKNGLQGIAAMARSTNRSTKDGDSRVTAPTERGETRDLAEPRELSLEEVLKSYEQPINEEQAWAVCHQCCSGLRQPRPPAGALRRVKDPSSILLHRDGTVALQQESGRDGRTTSDASANLAPCRVWSCSEVQAEQSRAAFTLCSSVACISGRCW